MARIEITVPGERITEEFTALVQQQTTPVGAPPVKVGLVEISQHMPTELIPGPVGPQGPRGSRWFTGSGDPSTPGGVTGDMYLDDVSGAVWTWDGTAWVNTGTNIQGSPDTGPQILAKLAPVDGAGSGLDADLLDGQHGAYYLDWPNQTNKPTTFPPTLPIPWSGISGQPATYPPTLPIPSSGVTGLDAKQASQDTAINGKVGPDAPSDGLTYGRKDAAWSTIVGGAVISDTPPPGPLTPGQLWWESDTGNTYIWVQDADSSQWVQQNIQPLPSYLGDYVLKTGDTMTGPLSATVLNTTTGNITSASHVISTGSFIGGGGSTSFAIGTFSGAPNIIYVRPNGYNNATKQSLFPTDGSFTSGGTMVVATAADTTGGAVKGTTMYSGQTRTSTDVNTASAHRPFYTPSGFAGQISTTNATTAYGTTSDGELKEVHGQFSAQSAIDIIRADPVLAWTWKVGDGGEGVGWVAQKSYALNTDLAVPPTPGPEEGVEGNTWTIDYGRRTPYLWAALSAALDKIDQLEARLAVLEGGV